MKQPIQIQVYDQDTKAAIKVIEPGCTVEAIRDALEAEYIRNGINWNRIGECVRQVTESGTSQFNVTIATSTKLPLSIQYGNTGPILSGGEIETLRRNLRTIGRALRYQDTSVKLSGGVFIRSGEIALTVHVNETFLNVYGEDVPLLNKEKPYPKEKCLTIKSVPEGYQMVALVSGFLIINERGAFDIVDPFFTSEDRLTLYSHILPLTWGEQSYIDKIIRSTPPISSEITVNHIDNLSTLFDIDTLSSLSLRQGRPSVPGRPGAITFMLPPDPPPPSQDGDRVDYRAVSQFREIAEGMVVAERVPMIQSITGIDVFGEPLPVTKVKDYIFSYGDGIFEEATPDLISYKAKERGVLQLEDHYVNVSPVLTINGDVCSETGNITFSRSVIVHGTIRSGFSVTCGDLTVRENIEDATRITCKGCLTVRKGIFGERTKVFVEKDAKIGRVQNAYLRVNGNCIIDEYVYHAKIYCRANVHITGRGRIDFHKGCVIGGEICGIKTLDIHSIGSSATLTTVTCGFDSEHFATLNQSLSLETTLKKKILLLQNKVHLKNLDKETIAERVKSYSPEKRQMLKNTLEELRFTIGQLEKTGASIALLTRKTMAPDIDKSLIIIRNHVIPQILVVFPHAKKKIYREYKEITIAYHDHEIQIIDSVMPFPDNEPDL
jgi:uncharacterized protein (DUF342 family)